MTSNDEPVADRRRADALLDLPVAHLRREHVLARRLVAAAPHHPDLVAVHHDGSAAEEVEQAVAEQDALLQLGVGGPEGLVAIMRAAAPGVVVAEERRGRRRDPRRAAEVVVVGEPRRDAPRAGGAAGEAVERVLQREVDHVGQPAVAHVAGELDRVGLEDLAEDLEVVDPGRARGGADLREPGAEEGAVDVLRGVDPEAVDPVAL